MSTLHGLGEMVRLVLRRDRVEHEHFRIPTVIPYLGVASCLVLLTQQSAEIWLRAAILIAVGVILYIISTVVMKRTGQRAGTAAADG